MSYSFNDKSGAVCYTVPMKTIIVFLFTAACASAAATGFVMEHGTYSDAYLGDWKNLPTGKDIAKKDLTAVPFADVAGEQARERIEDKDRVYLTNRAVRVSWSSPTDKYKTAMYYIRECKTVHVENMYIVQKNADNAGSHGIFIEDCDTVIVKNSYFAGALSQVHLRIENCRYVFIDGVEIAGIDYEGNGQRRNGIGIFIEGGQMDESGKLFRRYSSNARDIEWLTIQNCYIHDYTYGDKWENKDGIQIHSAPNGILFNNYIERWDNRYADGAMDVSHRRTDLSNRVLRIERNIVKNCSLTKTPGTGTPDDAVVWVNNIFINAFHGDYHHTWRNVFIHNTWIFDDPQANIFFKLWNVTGPAYVINSLVAASNPVLMVFQNNDGSVEKYRNYHPRNGLYAVPANPTWLSGVRKESFSYEDWRRAGKDAGSEIIAVDRVVVDPGSERYSVAVRGNTDAEFVTTNDIRYRVSRDFYGNKRPSRPTAGAVEMR